MMNPTLVSVTVLGTMFFERPQFASNDPLFWMFASITVVSFIVSCSVFMTLEKRNQYLTANLNAEVLTQTAALRNLISERENLIRFLSHDLKKPLISVGMFLGTLTSQTTDPESKKLIEVIGKKNDEALRNLSDVSRYSKYNYLSEISESVDIGELCEKIYKDIEPDCAANGIILKNNVCGSFTVFAKPAGLESTMMNIIINAIEHADCTLITVLASKQKNKCVITVRDNGKGIDSENDIFKPYVSENESGEANGLGLFICREMIRAMSGTLTYICDNSGTSFIITLPLA